MSAKRLIAGMNALIGFLLVSVGIYGYIKNDPPLAPFVGTGVLMLVIAAIMLWTEAEKKVCVDCGFEHCKCSPPAETKEPAAAPPEDEPRPGAGREEKKDKKC